MNYRNVCFSCHSYIGDYIVEILKEVEALQEEKQVVGSITPVLDIMELSEAPTKGAFVRNWLDERKITKLCCRDALRDAANMKEFDRKVNLNKL